MHTKLVNIHSQLLKRNTMDMVSTVTDGLLVWPAVSTPGGLMLETSLVTGLLVHGSGLTLFCFFNKVLAVEVVLVFTPFATVVAAATNMYIKFLHIELESMLNALLVHVAFYFILLVAQLLLRTDVIPLFPLFRCTALFVGGAFNTEIKWIMKHHGFYLHCLVY